MMPCLLDCDSLVELGPPPDLIAGMPPPPIPAFLRDPVDLLVATNGSCSLCGWADGDDVQLIEITRKYPMIDDMWYFVIVSAAVGAILFGILIVIAALRCKEAKVKPVHDCTKSEKGHPGMAVEPLASPPNPMSMPPGMPLGGSTHPKALWTGLKNAESSAYALHHHSINPDLLVNYERIDYGSVGNTRPMSPTFKMASPIPPPLPLNPPPPICPTYCGQTEAGVHIMGNGNAYYANPESLDGSFENSGYIDSECSMEVQRIAPDGAVVSRRGRPCPLPVHSGGRWEEAIVRQRFEIVPGMAKLRANTTCREQAIDCEGFKVRGYAMPTVAQLGHPQVSSPLV